MKKFGTVIFLIITMLLFFSLEQKIRLLDKNSYDYYINKYSKRFCVDPLLIKAIMKKESNLNSSAISNKGAVGLMQIMPKTAFEIAGELNVTDYSQIKLKEIDINIMFGTYYIKKLLNYYNNNFILALAAYNAGRGNTDSWYKENPIIGKKISKIPFRETKYYVRDIIFTYKVYQGAEKLKTLIKN
jgi:soluble lytic murein transglycosylase